MHNQGVWIGAGLILASLSLAELLPTSALAKGSSYFDVTGMSVLIHRGEHDIFPKDRHRVDDAGVMTCKSANGCDLSIQTSMLVPDTEYSLYVYTLVDGQHAHPHDYAQFSSTNSTLQSVFDLSQGEHVVQTFIIEDVSPGSKPQVLDWQINYTMYDK